MFVWVELMNWLVRPKYGSNIHGICILLCTKSVLWCINTVYMLYQTAKLSITSITVYTILFSVWLRFNFTKLEPVSPGLGTCNTNTVSQTQYKLKQHTTTSLPHIIFIIFCYHTKIKIWRISATLCRKQKIFPCQIIN